MKEVFVPLENGDTADIAAGIRRAAELNVDLMVIARGGGRQIMLQRFSHADVIRSVADAAARVPVIVAIGHERDQVDAEKVAWRRASTPNGAGALVATELRIRRWQARQAATAAHEEIAMVETPVSVRTPYQASKRTRDSKSWQTRPGRPRQGSLAGLLVILVLAAIGYLGLRYFTSWMSDQILARPAPSVGRAVPDHVGAPSESRERRDDSRGPRRKKSLGSSPTE